MLQKGLYSVAASPTDPDLLILRKNNAPVGKKDVRISEIRAYLVGPATAHYTLNAVVRMAKFVSQELGLNYRIPTDLAGTEEDDRKIIPDQVAMGILLLQAVAGVTPDGIPGADFIRQVMKLHRDVLLPAQCRAVFMDESNNRNITSSKGNPIVQPDADAAPADIYDFLREITLARNGLWSDRPNIVNLAGLRLQNGLIGIQWDDTIGAAWLGADGKKNAHLYIATTEPGNRKINKTMLPQTVIFAPGYHQGKLPAMRGYRTVAFDPTAKFPERLVFNTRDERGLNLHPGGGAGAMKNLVKYVFPVVAETEAEFQAVMVIMEIFEILSRWGLDTEKTAWQNLIEWAALKALKTGNTKNGVVPVFQDEHSGPVKTIPTAAAKAWMIQKWSKNRPVLLKILQFVDPGFKAPANFNTVNAAEWSKVITDAHIEGVVRKQCDCFFDLKEIDGLAGNNFLSIVEGKTPNDGALARWANGDFVRITALFEKFGPNHPILTPERLNYVQQIKTQTELERKRIQAAMEKMADQQASRGIDDVVSNWSVLCQVVFGPEKFYELMDLALKNALSTGQRRWYYTLIDESSLPK